MPQVNQKTKNDLSNTPIIINTPEVLYMEQLIITVNWQIQKK